MFRTIQHRIALPYTLLFLVAMLGTGFYLSSQIAGDHQGRLSETLSNNTRMVAEYLSTPLIEDRILDVPISQVKSWAEILEARITVIAPDGVVLLDSYEDPLTMDNHLMRPEIQAAIQAGEGNSTRYSVTVGSTNMYKAVRIMDGTRLAGIVRLSIPISKAEGSIKNIQSTLAVSTVLVSIMVVILSQIIATGTTRPIREITAAVTRLSSNDTITDSNLIRLKGSDPVEIATLASAYNQMASRLYAQISALQAEQSKNLAVLQAMTDGVIIVDDNGIVRLINRSAQQIFGISEDLGLNRSLAEVIRHHQIYTLWNKTHETGKPLADNLELAANKLYLHVMLAPLDQYQQGSTLLLVHNLTRQRYLETVRRDFVTNISHELRTPLASLKAIAETLQSGAMEDPPAARRFLQRMETEVDALTQMVTELLELSRIESGRVPLHTSPVHPNDIVLPAVDRLHLQAERAKIRLEINCPDELPLIEADPVRLQQVLVNLLHNAIKFTHPGGKITVHVEPGSLSDSHIPMLVFSVADTGVGINPDDINRIFERFYKTDKARTSGGTGLGLAIARHLVEAHQGKIWAESLEGHGSTFRFSIPQARMQGE